MIRQCKLPPLVIRKLGLTFPKQRSNRKYGDVHFDYGTVVHEGQSEPVVNVSGHELEPENPKLSSNEDCIGAKQTHLQDQTLAKLKGTKKKMSRIKGNLQKFDQEQRNSSSEEDEASEIEDRKSESVSHMFSWLNCMMSCQPCHLNQWCFIVCWALGNKPQWNNMLNCQIEGLARM